MDLERVRIVGSDIGKIEGVTAAADIVTGYQGFSATTANTTVVTIPAGRTWVGTVSVECACQEAAAGTVTAQATGIITTAGTGVTPAAGTYGRCDALAGANAATGTVGTDATATLQFPLTVVAPGGNAVQIQASATIAGTGGQVNVTASGTLQ